MNDIENGWILTDNDLPESHWGDDRTDELVEEYAGDRDIITDAVAFWLDTDGGDPDRLQVVYDHLPADIQKEILQSYIELNNRQNDFDIWWEVRFNG
ncbi:MAG: hypothetical protein IKU34_12280 [Clostridia bacterium]|nr:hypothetical protein [Clostridia bacterium]